MMMMTMKTPGVQARTPMYQVNDRSITKTEK